ncbi:MAG: sigma-54 dependent transcriptional regulator [Blastocatellia bacterium]|nr:sigma-54 dependent transcriptional regulator [Blastocatellia bacterium]MCS7157585.1 sigma-54 dependent transcriptional regulator [Blastocatellia bacterium]MCX7751850.1 sigma-54 dependent transcriptional regulator [Blastocatellia bacterium]MDW8166956.1 sigma-54 dependent transcriptional regulator [Acidobacteriota bacterium]MDW8257060.1 sigma-54 dependent transcriptional regulator [Acidobacteriota bacterium]
MFKILIVDDEATVRTFVQQALADEEYEIQTAANVSEALERAREEVFDLVITDLMMTPLSGMDLLRAIKEISPDTEVLMMTAYGTIETAVQAMKLGACDYITKPFPIDELRLRVAHILERKRLQRENRWLREELLHHFGIENLVGQSSPFLQVLEKVRRVAPSDATVLLTGETGTGKDVIARAIHLLSRRASRPFISVNCAALPEQLLESELFGHVKGAFTGAVANRRGLIEEASGGTFFLDEIGSVPLSIQAKLLRVLENKTIRRLGENREIPVDVRIIAATNRDLHDALRRGEFREDLYYRLNVVTIHLPPLRARREDIPLLAHHFLRQFCQREQKVILGFSEAAMSALMHYAFPGNVRELRHIIEQAVALTTGQWITIADLPAHVRISTAPSEEREAETILHQVERDLILQAIERNEGHLERTARDLGISRVTLWRKMKKYGLAKRFVSSSNSPEDTSP